MTITAGDRIKNALVKPSKVIKDVTSNVRTHQDVVQRARDIYLGQMKRAEAEYFDRINRATKIITGEEDPAEAVVSDETPATPQPSA